MTKQQLDDLIDLINRSIKCIEDNKTLPYVRNEVLNDLKSLKRGLEGDK